MEEQLEKIAKELHELNDNIDFLSYCGDIPIAEILWDIRESLSCVESHAKQKGKLNMAELLYLIELNTRK